MFIDLFIRYFPGICNIMEWSIILNSNIIIKKCLYWNTTEVKPHYKQKSNVLECIFIPAISMFQSL